MSQLPSRSCSVGYGWWPGWHWCCRAGPGTLHAQQFSFRQYAQSDGLTNLAAGYLVTDPGGDLWVGTDGGLFRFDGTAFVSYDTAHGLPSETVRGMALDPSGRLWVTLDRGLYVGGAEGFEPVRTPERSGHHRPRSAHRLPRQGSRSRRHTRATSWSCAASIPSAGSGISTRSSRAEQLKATPQLDKVVSFFTESDGTLWLGCGKQLCSAAAGKLRTWGAADGVPEGSYGAFLLTTTVVSGFGAAITCWCARPARRTFVVNDPPHARLESRVVEPMLTLDAGGRLLTRTAPGVARWDGTRWQEFSTDNGLADSVIAKAQVDGEGSLWLSPLGLGIWRWRGYDNVESWTRAQGFISQKVWNIVRDHDGRLLVGTERGCQVLDEAAGRVDRLPVRGTSPRWRTSRWPSIRAAAVGMASENSELWTVPPHENTRAPGEVSRRQGHGLDHLFRSLR